MSGNYEADALLVSDSDSDSEGETTPAVVERRRKGTLDWFPGNNVPMIRTHVKCKEHQYYLCTNSLHRCPILLKT